MAFSTFSIRDKDSHSVIDCDSIDLRIKDFFILGNINYLGKEDRYCQFYFNDLEQSSGFQKSISWAGLIHTIIYHSEIEYGPASTYDIEAAAEYVRLHSIHFPKSGCIFLSEILKMLNEWGYYIFVEEHSECEEFTECYFSEDKSQFLIKTSLGICTCSQDGELMQFIPSLQKDYYYHSDWPKEIKKIDPGFSRAIQLGTSDLPQYIIDWINSNIQKFIQKEQVDVHVDKTIHVIENFHEIHNEKQPLNSTQCDDVDMVEGEREERSSEEYANQYSSENKKHNCILQRVFHYIFRKK